MNCINTCKAYQEKRIIDFHMHPFLTKKEYLGNYPDSFYMNVEDAKKDLLSIGIGHICGSVIAGREGYQQNGFDHIRELNQTALLLKEQYGDFYTPGFHIHPDYVTESCEEIEIMKEHNIHLIGELVPYMHGWDDYSHRGLYDILEFASRYNPVVSFHTMGEDRFINEMISNFPQITFVAAHPGEKENYLKHISRMKIYKNAYLDLSGTGIFRYGMLKYGVEQVGSERFLLGTDFPICNPSVFVYSVLGEHIKEDDKENILYRNAARILR